MQGAAAFPPLTFVPCPGRAWASHPAREECQRERLQPPPYTCPSREVGGLAGRELGGSLQHFLLGKLTVCFTGRLPGTVFPPEFVPWGSAELFPCTP